jgi:dTDP-4-amino-4,6-dideoxygalactose transaminase
LVTNDDELAERAYVLRDKGTNKRSFIDQKDLGYYEYQMLGNSYVQSDILGALALSQLKKLDWMNRRRAEHATYLSNGLSGINDLELPGLDVDVESNWHLYSVRVPEDRLLEFRDELNNEGVGCNTHYHPLHINSLYKDLGYNENDFPSHSCIQDIAKTAYVSATYQRGTGPYR